jgi:hypothetical protein
MAKPHQRLILLSLGCGAVALATVLGLRAQRFPAEAAADPSGSFPPPPRDEAPAPPAGWGSSTSPATPEGPIVALPSDPSLRRVGDGRHYPLVPSDPGQLAQLLVAVEEALRSSFTDPAALPALGHQQQVIYRVLSHKTALADQVRPSIPPRWLSVYDRHLAARREFLAMHRGGKKPDTLPAWRIVQPEPPENLIRYYKQAEQATGIEWARRLLSVKRPDVHGLRDNRAQLLHRHQLRATDPLLNIATARPSPPTQARGAAPYPVAIATCSLRKRNNLLML